MISNVSETGYSYFGARYYDSEGSFWLSVDPLSDRRQGLSPYNYVRWNPLNRVDPDGMLDKGKKPKRRRFRMRNRNMGRHQRNLRWRNPGPSQPPAYRVARGLGKLPTVPMGRYGTSQWTPIGTGGPGKTIFSWNRPEYNLNKLRGIRIFGQSGGIFGTLITTGPNIDNGAFGFPIDGFGGLFFRVNGFDAGFIPFLNFALYLNSFRGRFNLLGIFGIVPNSFRLNPAFRNSNNWAVYRGGKARDLNYTFSIRFRVWNPYTPGNTGSNPRPFWHQWWYF